MTKATAKSSTTEQRPRSQLAVTASGGATFSAALGQTNPDEELIMICAEYEAAERKIEALFKPEDIDQDHAIRSMDSIIEEELGPLLARMEEIHAQTPAGIYARARAMATNNLGFAFSFDEEGTVPHRLLNCLMQDAMALSRGAE